MMTVGLEFRNATEILLPIFTTIRITTAQSVVAHTSLPAPTRREIDLALERGDAHDCPGFSAKLF
jgi:hypothetical protein